MGRRLDRLISASSPASNDWVAGVAIERPPFPSRIPIRASTGIPVFRVAFERWDRGTKRKELPDLIWA